MAVKWLPLVHEGTSTAGTGTLTLDGTPPADRRSFVTAQANGEIAASGDEVYFMVSDLAAGGTNWELNRGTWTAAGNTLTRTNPPVKSSNGGALVNFPGGGKRDVVTVIDPILFALLGVANIFTASGVAIKLHGVSNPELEIAENGATASALRFLDEATGAARITKTAATGAVTLDLEAIPTDGTSAATYRFFRRTSTSGARAFNFYQGDGSGTILHSISSTGASFTGTVTVGGAAVALQGVLSAPAGTSLFFPLQSTVPAGFTKNTSHNDAALRVVSGTVAPTGGTRGLSSAAVGGTILSLSQIPSHFHSTEALLVGTAGSGLNVPVNPYGGTGTERQTDSKGGGGEHDHALALKYVDGVIGTKT